MKPAEPTKKDVRPVKTHAPNCLVEKSRPNGQSKNARVANHLEKENASSTAMKATQDGKLPPKNGKTSMFTLPYIVYNIDYNTVDDLKRSLANITYFDLLKLTQQRDLLLKAMNECNCKSPTNLTSQTKKSASRPIRTP